MRKSRYAEEQIAMAFLQAEAGTTVEEICCKLGVSSATFFPWKKMYGGLGVPELRELRLLREENRRLKDLVADLTLDKSMLQESLRKTGDPCAAPGAGCVGHIGIPGSGEESQPCFRSLPQQCSVREQKAEPGAAAAAPSRSRRGANACRIQAAPCETSPRRLESQPQANLAAVQRRRAVAAAQEATEAA